MTGGIDVQGSRIRHRRGDTGVLRLFLFLGDSAYTIKDTDKAVLTVKKNFKSDAILQIPMEESEFIFQPADTQGMKPGKYKYDVQVTLTTGEVVTVALGDYILLPDVTTEVTA